jgi:hypothetical protein
MVSWRDTTAEMQYLMYSTLKGWFVEVDGRSRYKAEYTKYWLIVPLRAVEKGYGQRSVCLEKNDCDRLCVYQAEKRSGWRSLLVINDKASVQSVSGRYTRTRGHITGYPLSDCSTHLPSTHFGPYSIIY